MSISEIVNKIRTTVYAKDVREAIATGFEQINAIADAVCTTRIETASLIPLQNLIESRSGMYNLVDNGGIEIVNKGKYLISAMVSKSGICTIKISSSTKEKTVTTGSDISRMYLEPTLYNLEAGDIVEIYCSSPSPEAYGINSVDFHIQKVG